MFDEFDESQMNLVWNIFLKQLKVADFILNHLFQSLELQTLETTFAS